MTDSAASFIAILLGLGIFAVIVAVGWRSVQNRRIVRLQGANGQETIIVASEDDDVTSIETASTETTPAAPATTRADSAEPPGETPPAGEFGRSESPRETPV